mmetsp:Transcript_38022/g.102974  ORF Transcript_38022/g.102974 Transcript_38022/m.102974 type:complete len:249 (-) Transcript_38022:199-945(-)
MAARLGKLATCAQGLQGRPREPPVASVVGAVAASLGSVPAVSMVMFCCMGRLWRGCHQLQPRRGRVPEATAGSVCARHVHRRTLREAQVRSGQAAGVGVGDGHLAGSLAGAVRDPREGLLQVEVEVLPAVVAVDPPVAAQGRRGAVARGKAGEVVALPVVVEVRGAIDARPVGVDDPPGIARVQAVAMLVPVHVVALAISLVEGSLPGGVALLRKDKAIEELLLLADAVEDEGADRVMRRGRRRSGRC